MTARASAGRPISVGIGQELARWINFLNDLNATRKIFGVITNLSRPDAGNYTYPLLAAGLCY
jgi:hypothetical protein